MAGLPRIRVAAIVAPNSMLRLLCLASIFSVFVLFVPAAVLGGLPGRTFRFHFLVVVLKLVVVVPLFIPLYLILYPIYDGNTAFMDATGYLAEPVYKVLADLRLSGGTSNLAKMVGVLRHLLDTTVVESHFLPAALGLAGSLIYASATLKYYPAVPASLVNGAFLFWPSIFVFSMLLLKDPFAHFFLSLIFLGVLRFSRGPSRGISASGPVVFGIGGLCFTRSYVAAIVVGALLAWGLHLLWRRGGRANKFIVFASIGLLITGGWAASLVTAVLGEMLPGLEEFSFQGVMGTLQSIRRELSDGASAFELREIRTAGDLIYLPLNVATVFTKPFVTEVRNLPTFMAGLESLAATLLLGYLLIHLGKLRRVLSQDSAALFSLYYCMGILGLFAFVAGNSGTLFRQKIMFLPFFFHLVLALISSRRSAMGTPLPVMAVNSLG